MDFINNRPNTRLEKHKDQSLTGALITEDDECCFEIQKVEHEAKLSNKS